MTDDFAAFYEGSFTPVFAAVRAFCGDTDVARDATQEAFARAYARWRRVKATSSPQAWVVTTAFNLTRRHFRRERTQVETASTVLSGPTPDRVGVLDALRALPERQRQAVVLHYLLDTPVAMVAEAMGVSEGAVKAHLFKARSALRGALEVRHG